MQRATTAAVATGDPGASAPPVDARPYVEGAVGAPGSITPLTARTQVDRDLVALIFSGLVRNGPAGTIVPDLAERWSVDDGGKTWTVTSGPMRGGTTASRSRPTTSSSRSAPSRTPTTRARPRGRGAR